MNKKLAAITISVGLGLGGFTGVLLGSPSIASAQESTETPVAGSTETAAKAQKGKRGNRLESVATIIGVTVDELKAALKAGQTIAQVAESKGVAVQTVIDAQVAAIKAKIQTKVDDGTITQAEADAKLADLTTRVTEKVNTVKTEGAKGAKGEHSGRGGRGERGQRGAAPAAGSESPATTVAA